MKKLIIVLAGALLLLAGCKDGNGDGVVTVKAGSPKEAAPSGDELWDKACRHALALMKTDGLMAELEEKELEEALDEAVKDCKSEFTEVGGHDADEAARCVLRLDSFDVETFAECDPKKRSRKDEEK